MSEAPAEPVEGAEGTEGAEENVKLSLDVDIKESGTCQRHVTVTVSREDIERYYTNVIDELVPKAEVPGFRPGRAPKRLVAARFKQQVDEQVKGGLLMDAMEQVTDEADFSAISEPDLNYSAVKVPADGPMTFEFNIEVRPEFDVPKWEGLTLERPVRKVDDEAVTEHLNTVLLRYGETVHAEEAEDEDVLEVSMEFKLDGKVISKVDEEYVRVRPTLSFGNAELEGFDELARGAKKGGKLEAKVTISEEDSDEDLKGKEVDLSMTIKDIERRELPKLTPNFLETLGGFEDEEELREVIHKDLERQHNYHQKRRIREQISSLLTKDANWELPPDLLRRQAARELERAVLELESSGFSMDQINAHANQLRQNSLRSTEAALKEHFILERIAEDLNVDAEPQDYDMEIQLIAMQRNEPARRVRARMEKRGQLDTLRNQIIERKVIEQIMEKADFNDIDTETSAKNDVTAISHAIGHRADIAEAEHGEEAELREQTDHT